MKLWPPKTEKLRPKRDTIKKLQGLLRFRHRPRNELVCTTRDHGYGTAVL
jgi:hypothetical protein